MKLSGISALKAVVTALRADGHVSDEEGDLTNDLCDLHDALTENIKTAEQVIRQWMHDNDDWRDWMTADQMNRIVTLGHACAAVAFAGSCRNKECVNGPEVLQPATMCRIGESGAGRELDGRTWEGTTT